MAKNDSWRPRKSRKRGFDDDGPDFGGWAPPPPMPGGPPPMRQSSVFASGPEVKAVVKWFNAEKGFGFVELGDGSGDAFLHVSVVQRAGADAVAPGANLRVRVGPGQKGQQVTEVLEIAEGEAPPPRSGGFGGGPRTGGGFGGGGGGGGSRGYVPAGPAEEVRGTVKWYSAEKGFGFVSPEGGGRDVFVHATALERSGLPPLGEGQAVVMQVVQGKKGPEASSLTKA
ncbi:cold-shock protein [Siccirubricoccus phaeus]|uniref:cold-shock protein n=1 Tax=Siccirubricoccus phaeus TaxID=2595053 RepID=UPI00165BFBAA|nr:cold shock domain-containing protein [Siccirubricoccus phaeus]